MPSAQIIGSQVTITGLGKMSVSTKERDAIHVVLGKKAALESVSDAYYKHPRGIRLLADEQGQVGSRWRSFIWRFFIKFSC